jgi:hypothetical protein
MNLGLSLSLGGMRAGGGGATALPASADLSMHFKAEDITPQTDNSALASWTDSVSSVTISQGTPLNQPLYRTSRTNSLPAVQFTGNTWLTVGRPTQLTTPLGQNANATGFTLFFVVANVDQGNTQGFRTLWSPSNVNDTDRTIIMTGGYGGARFRRQNLPTAGLQVVTVTGRRLGGVTRSEIAFNGNAIWRYNVNPSLHPTNNYQLGSATGDPSWGLRGDVMEWGCYNRALTLAETYTFIKYACDKYAQPYPWAGLSYYEVFDGDSQTHGEGGTFTSFQDGTWPNYLMASNSRGFGSYTNLALGGLTSSHLTAYATVHYAGLSQAIGLPVIVHGFEYYNQPDANAAGVKAWVAAIKAADPSLITVIGSSIDNGQLPGDFRRDNRASFNTAISAPDANIDVFVPIHTDPNVGVEGACPDNPGPYGPNFADVVGHPTNAGYQVIASFWGSYRDTAVGLI